MQYLTMLHKYNTGSNLNEFYLFHKSSSLNRKSLEDRLNNSKLSQVREQGRIYQDKRDELLGLKQSGSKET